MKLYLIICALALLHLGCVNRNRAILKKNSSIVLKKYNMLLKQTDTFLSLKSQENFKDSLFSYIKNCKEYNFNDGRLPAAIDEIMFVNIDYTKAVIPILKRTLDLSGGRLEYVNWVSAQLKDNRWIFQLKRGHSNSVSYINDYPSLSDRELSINGLQHLMLLQDIHENDIYNEKLFSSDMYVLK